MKHPPTRQKSVRPSKGKAVQPEKPDTQVYASLGANHPPIDSPFEEKRLIEKGESMAYAGYLMKKLGTSRLTENPGVLDARIIEVYRRCSEDGKFLDVVEDFVASHPRLVFKSKWLAERVERESLVWQFGLDWDAPTKLNPLLRALHCGLRRAALPPATRIRRQLKRTRLPAARIVQQDMAGDLREFAESCDLRGMKREKAMNQISEIVSSKADQIVGQNPHRLSSLRSRIMDLLLDGQTYKASVLIASHLFNVSPRALERNPY